MGQMAGAIGVRKGKFIVAASGISALYTCHVYMNGKQIEERRIQIREPIGMRSH